MYSGRIVNGTVSYGVARRLGKALAVVCFTAGAVQAEEVTVLAFGDSLTQGYGLPQEDGFVPQLQAWLDAAGEEVTLINGGVSGDTTAGGAARIDWSLTADVDAMILTLGGNDFLRGIDPDVSKANLAAILDVAEQKGVDVLLVGMIANGNYGPDYKTRFDAMYPDLAEARGAALYPYFFDGLGRGEPGSFIPYFQADRIHPNAEGIRLIVEDMGPAVVELIDAVEVEN